MLKKYIKYYNDNPQGLWFKRKVFGWGWTPVRWQGWFVIAVYITVVICFFTKADETSRSGSDTLIIFSTPFLIATAILLAICYAKGEKPKWQWGIEEK